MELTRTEFEQMLETTCQSVLKYLFDRKFTPVQRKITPEEQQDNSELTISKQPTNQSLQELLDRIMTAAESGRNSRHPGYMQYMPSGGLLHSVLSDLVGKCLNKYTGYYMGAPDLVDLECKVIRWLCSVFDLDLDSGAFGILTTGGTASNLSAVLMARDKLLQPNIFHLGCVYWTKQTHASCIKSCRIAGVAQNVRIIPHKPANSDEAFTIDLDELEKQIQDDHRSNLCPFLIVANVGSVDTGAIDDIQGLSLLAKKYQLWLHADGAYGAYFALVEPIPKALESLNLCDSISADLHKSFFLPLGTGFFSNVNFAELSLELTREIRGLRVWLPLKLLGSNTFALCLKEKLDLIQYLHSELEQIPGIVIISKPVLSILTFRHIPKILRHLFEKEQRVVQDANVESQLLAHNTQLLSSINSRGRVALHSTKLYLNHDDEQAVMVIRIVVLSYLTHRTQVDQCISDIKDSCMTIDTQTVASM
ncbi:unnamed protein product [Didymodactylos carnosus]|uniref:Tyrosine decarboxylase n=2 Tax=Didymodactylos carnosus TaxID=1234261 RepID=A0A815XW97_9BILA|nr:unnamed protein product [Didymodactylos carnosus]CAF4425062.1 unnamed protein product [Didymodactylos carnosus]